MSVEVKGDSAAALLNDVRSKLTGRAFLSNDVRFIHRSSSGSWTPNRSLDVANMSIDDLAGTGYYYSPHSDHYPIEVVSVIARVMGMLGIFPEDMTEVLIVRNYDAIEVLEAAGVRCVSGYWSKRSGYWEKPGGCAEIPDGAVIVKPLPADNVNIARRIPRIVIDVDTLEAAGYDLRGGILDYYIHRHLMSLTAFSNIPRHADRSTMEDIYSVLACGYKDYSDLFSFNYGECHQTLRLLDEYSACISFTGDKFTERFNQLDKEISGIARLWVVVLARTVLDVRPCADLDELGKQVELLKKITPIDSMLEAFYKYNISIDDILCVSSVEED